MEKIDKLNISINRIRNGWAVEIYGFGAGCRIPQSVTYAWSE